MDVTVESAAVQSAARDRLHFWYALGAAGLAARFVLAWLSIGCDDAQIWLGHSYNIDTQGLSHALTTKPEGGWHYNHPPLMGYWAQFSGRIGHFDPLAFARLMKLPGLLGELVSAYLVHRVWSAREPRQAALAFAVYGTSLPLILVSGYHCNTECLYGALGLLAVWLMEDGKRPYWSGVALAGALNVKLLPVFLGPALLARTRTRRDALAFCAGCAWAIVPFVPFLIGGARGMYANMVQYNSLQLEWGLMALLNAARDAPQLASFAPGLREFMIETGRYWILAGVLAVSGLEFVRRRLDGYTLGALAWAVFLVLTPGFGVQYSVSVLPLLVCADLRTSVRYSLSAGVMLFLIYSHRMVWQVPLQAGVQYFPMPQLAIYAGLLAWLVLAIFIAKNVRKLARRTG